MVVRDSSLSQPKTTFPFCPRLFPALFRELLLFTPQATLLWGVLWHHLPLASSPFTERDVRGAGVGSLARGPCLGILCHSLVTLVAASL